MLHVSCILRVRFSLGVSRLFPIRNESPTFSLLVFPLFRFLSLLLFFFFSSFRFENAIEKDETTSKVKLPRGVGGKVQKWKFRVGQRRNDDDDDEA